MIFNHCHDDGDCDTDLRAGLLQDAWLMQSVAEYFNKHIPDVPWDNEDAFIEVLRAAGLTDQQ